PPVNGERNVLLYFKSDIIQYRDPVINATVGDAYRLAADNGFTSNTPVSHGNGDQGKEDQLGWIIKNLDRKLTFSFHAYHIPVKKYALDKVGGALSPAESAEKKEALIEKYTRRFTPLLSAAIAHNKLANIRILAHGALLKYILGKSGDNKYAAAVLKEIQGVQEQVWKHIRKNILRGNLHADINDYVRKNGYGELKPYSIYWSGRAEKFLLELGVEPRVIRELRKNEEMIFGEGKSSRIVAPDFFLLAEPDGSISLQLAEDSGTRFRAVSEIFRGSQDEQFRLFADFLTIIYRTVRASPAGRSAPVKVSAENLTPGTRDILLDKLKIGKDDLKRPLYFTLEETKNNSGIGYYQLLFKFLAPDNRLEKLLAGQLNSRTLETLYLTLKDLPVPVSINFFVNVGNDRALMLRHRLIRGNHPALRKIAGVTVRSFPTGKRIFSPAEDNGSAAIPALNPGTPLSGPVVSRPLPEPFTPGISLFDYAV
ncbi:MAG: hypothetical protein PHO30_07825, partial [Candidatus Omnitrophica bacterium]|nr:hypothetical protein [Candidatus Omnitrophota bacterium]